MLRIRADKLITAMLNSRVEDVYYLDLETGDIVIFGEDDGTGMTKEGLTFGIDYTPELRFMFIEPLLSEERQWMVKHFVGSLPESILKHRLSKELNAGRSLKLSQYPGLMNQWDAFIESEIIDLYSRWLSQIGVKARIISGGVIKGSGAGSGEYPEQAEGLVI